MAFLVLCDRSIDFAALTKFDCILAKKMTKHYAEISGNQVDFDYAVLIEKMICYNGITEAANNIYKNDPAKRIILRGRFFLEIFYLLSIAKRLRFGFL